MAKYATGRRFSIKEHENGTLTYIPGHERIPDNWYRRPRGELVEYPPVSFVKDLLQIIKTVPEAVLVGGNTGTVNSFTGVDLGNMTGGAYNTLDLLNPMKFGCFFHQLILAVVPDVFRNRLLGDVLSSALNLLSDKLNPFIDSDCAKIGK
jgi:hypothetical protein